jgi:hypothetical protein
MLKLYHQIGTAALLLSTSQFAATQGFVTESGTDRFVESVVSSQELASNGRQRNDYRQIFPDEYAATGGQAAEQAPIHTQFDFIVYPGQDMTVNGMPVYVSARLKIGDRVKTGEATSKIIVGSVILELGLETTVEIGEPLNLICGVIVVRNGTITINDGKNTASFTSGQTAYATSTSCGSGLPDSPGAAQSSADSGSRSKSRQGALTPATGGWAFDSRVMTWSFWAVNAAMFSSSIVAAETTHNCLVARACTFVPDTFHRRRNMYLVGMPVAAGVSYFGYYLKRKGYRWWFVPNALVTVGNVVVITHAVHYSR